MDKKASRLRRSRQTRLKIAELGVSRLAVHRTNQHIYASIISGDGTKVLATASTVEVDVRKELSDKSGKGGNTEAGRDGRQARGREGDGPQASRRSRSIVAVSAITVGLKALAEAAREAGLKF